VSRAGPPCAPDCAADCAHVLPCEVLPCEVLPCEVGRPCRVAREPETDRVLPCKVCYVLVMCRAGLPTHCRRMRLLPLRLVWRPEESEQLLSRLVEVKSLNGTNYVRPDRVIAVQTSPTGSTVIVMDGGTTVNSSETTKAVVARLEAARMEA
jgi:hypothetical protein